MGTGNLWDANSIYNFMWFSDVISENLTGRIIELSILKIDAKGK